MRLISNRTLYYAVNTGRADMVENLIKSGADVNIVSEDDEYRNTLLYLAVSKSKIEI